MFRDQPCAIFEHGHHPEPEQIYFHQAEIGAVIFIPLNDHTSGHGRWLEWNDRTQLSLTDDHTAGVLTQVPREIENALADIQKTADTFIAHIKAGFPEMVIESVVCAFPFP